LVIGTSLKRIGGRDAMARLYRPGLGISPALEITGTAFGDARKRSRAEAASGCCTVWVRTPAKENPGCTSAGSAPTKVMMERNAPTKVMMERAHDCV